MTATGLKCLLILGSARENRMCERVFKFVSEQLNKRGWDVEVLDPIEMNLPVLSKPMHFYQNPGDIPKVLVDAAAKIKAADAFTIITCEYNHSLPPALTNIIDHFPPPSYSRRPSSIICYSMGPYGGMRAAMQARALLGEVYTVSIPNIFGIPKVHEALDASGGPLNEHMLPGVTKHLEELEWYAKALKAQREVSQ